MRNEVKSGESNGYPRYAPDCLVCRGTGMVHGKLYDPPGECDCYDRFDPSPVVDTKQDNAATHTGAVAPSVQSLVEQEVKP